MRIVDFRIREVRHLLDFQVATVTFARHTGRCGKLLSQGAELYQRVKQQEAQEKEEGFGERPSWTEARSPSIMLGLHPDAENLSPRVASPAAAWHELGLRITIRKYEHMVPSSPDVKLA